MSSSHVPSRRPKWLKNLFKRKRNEVLDHSSSAGHEAEATSLEGPQPSTLVENLKIGGRFALLLLPKIGECVDVNPAKMAFKILNVIMEVRKEINDNKDELQAVLEETLLLLSIVLVRMEAGPNPGSMVTQTVEQYKREVDKQLERVKALNGLLHPSLFKQVDYEYYKTQLTNVSREIGGATNRFNTAMSGITGITVEELRDDKRDTKLRQDLQPSEMADYRFIHNGKSALNRETCTEGTRVNILNDIMQWANDSSVGSAPVFWLSGQAGAGKTTIAYTIAKRFWKCQSTALGASFFCSRQFVETRSLQRIVPTIAFQLAQKCDPYRDSLHGIDTSDVAHYLNIREQLETILFQPWKVQKHQGNLPTYLVIVDALDEIEETKRSSFLEQLLRLLETDNIKGLKFLVTSRPDPDIVGLCKAFPPGAVCRLQDVPIEDAKSDVKTYLSIKLENIKGLPEFGQLNDQSAGLFIYAATVVKILTGRKLAYSEQLKRLRSLLSSTSSNLGSIDQLYQQIMRDAFGDLDDDPELLAARLSILYTFLCSAERISASVAANLLDTDIDVARLVLDNLHAVMYVQDGKVYWYHASFPDFIFNHARANFRLDDQHFEFSCNAAAQHGLLSGACFCIMNSEEIGLRFNIGDIKSSYLLDREHAEELRENVDKNILPVLRYACMHWSHHLSLLPDADDGRLCDVISHFLQIRVLFWIEAMNLVGSSGDCFHLLQNVAHWLSKNNRPGLAKDSQEVAYFAAYFSGSPATDSTPHLYISSLATWQSASLLTKAWKDKFFGIPFYNHTEGIVSLPLMIKRIKEWALDLAFSNDGKQIVAGCWTSVVVLDAATGRQQHAFKAKDFRWIRFSQDGTRLVVASLWNKHYDWVCIRDTSSFHLLQELYVLRAIVSTEGTHLFTCPSTLSDGFYQAQVMDIATGTLQGTVKMPKSTNTYGVLRFSNMLKKLLMQHLSSYSLEIWDISSEFALKTFALEGHSGRVFSTAMSPDGTLVATGSRDATARVWDTLTGKVLMVLPHEDGVVALGFSYDGTRLVSGSQDGSLHVWDTSTGAQLKVLDTNKNIGRSITFSRDGSRIASISDASVYVWSWDESEVGAVKQKQTSGSNIDIVRSNKSLLRLTSSSAEITISDDSKKIMSANMDRIQVWDSTTGAGIMTISSPDLRDMWSAKFSGNGEKLMWSGRAFLKVLNATTGNVVLDLKCDGSITIGETIAMSRSGRKFAFMKKFDTQPTSDSQSGERTYHSHLVIWDVETGKEKELVADTHTFFLSFSDDERYVVSGSVLNGPGCMVVWDVLTGDVTQTMKSNIEVSLHSPYANNGRQVAACIWYITRNSDPTSLCEIWDISSGEHLRTIKTSYWPHSNYGEEPSIAYSLGFRSVNLSHDGKKFAAACDDGFIRIWSYVSNESVADVILVGHSSMLDAVTFSKDDRRIVSFCWDGSARVWDLDTDTNREKYKWKLQDSGWIVASRQTGRRLMWVSERLEVMQPQNIMTMSRRGHGVIDFERAMIGEDWERCYSPQTSGR